MDYNELELINTPESIAKASITPTQVYILNSEGQVAQLKAADFQYDVISLSAYNSSAVFTTIFGVFAIENDAYSKPPLESTIKPILVIQGKFVECSVSSTHAAAIKEDGSLYAWGNLEHINIKTTDPILLQSSNLFISIYVHCGRNFTAVSTMGGFVYVYKDLHSSPMCIKELNSYFIVKICGNEDVLVSLSDTGNVLVWKDECLISMPINEDYEVKSIACSNNSIVGQCPDDQILCQWTGDRLETYAGTLVKYPASIKIFSGCKVCVTGQGVNYNDWEVLETANPYTITEYSLNLIHKLKDYRKSFINSCKNSVVLKSTNSTYSVRASHDPVAIRYHILLKLEILFKKNYRHCFDKVKKHGIQKTVIEKIVLLARTEAVLLKLLTQKYFLQVRHSFSTLKSLCEEKWNKKKAGKVFSEFIISFVSFKLNSFKKEFFSATKAAEKAAFMKKNCLIILYKAICNNLASTQAFIIETWRLKVRDWNYKKNQSRIIFYILKRICLIKILPVFQNLKMNTVKNLRGLIKVFRCLQKCLEHEKNLYFYKIFEYTQKNKKYTKRYKMILMFNVLIKITKPRKKAYFKEIAYLLQHKILRQGFIIYSLNHFTLIITKLKFRLKQEAINSLKTYYYKKLSLKIVLNLLKKRLSTYISLIKKTYFKNCIYLLVKNLKTLQNAKKSQNALYTFRAFLNLPSKPRKPFISYNRLLLNKKIKKEKEILAIKESMLTPRTSWKFYQTNYKTNTTTPENRGLGCVTERRMEYSIKLYQKIHRSKNNRKSSDFGLKKVYNNQTAVNGLVNSILKPFGRLFFKIFCIKKNKKTKSFSLLRK